MVTQPLPWALPVLVLYNTFGEENFPDIQSKSPLAQLEAISFCPVACYFGEGITSHQPKTSL